MFLAILSIRSELTNQKERNLTNQNALFTCSECINDFSLSRLLSHSWMNVLRRPRGLHFRLVVLTKALSVWNVSRNLSRNSKERRNMKWWTTPFNNRQKRWKWANNDYRIHSLLRRVIGGSTCRKCARVQGTGLRDKLSHSAQSPHLWTLDTQATPRGLIPTKYCKIGSTRSWRRTVATVHVTLVITLVCFVGISNRESFLVQSKSKFGAGLDGLTVFSPWYRWHWSKLKEIIFIIIIVIIILAKQRFTGHLGDSLLELGVNLIPG